MSASKISSKAPPRVHPLVRLHYPPRLLGHMIGSAGFISAILKYDPPSWIIMYLIFQGLAWPHLALLLSKRSSDPKKAEKYSLHADNFIFGCWVAALGYEPWLLLTIVMVSIAPMAANGIKGYTTSLLFAVVGAALTSYLYVFYFNPESALATIILSIIGTFVFLTVASYFAYSRSSAVLSLQKEQKKLSERLFRMNNLVKTASTSVSLSDMIKNIYPEAKVLLGFDSYFVLTFTHGSDALKINTLASDTINQATSERLLSLETNPKTTPSFVAEVIQRKELVYIKDVEAHQPLSDFDKSWYDIAPYTSVFLFPILNDNQVSGVIACQRHTEQFDFDEKEMIEINRYADQLSLMFNNALLFDDSRSTYEILNRNNEKLELANEQIQLQRDKVIKAKDELENSLQRLKTSQTQLIQQEKLASLGQLTAGIAHEIKNPLNFVTNFSDLSSELIDEIKEELNEFPDTENIRLISDNLDVVKSNLNKIFTYGTSADSTVKSMLQHSRSADTTFKNVDINKVVKKFTRLAFIGIRAGSTPVDVDITYQLSSGPLHISAIEEDLSRVIVNLCNNAFDTMWDKSVADKLQNYAPALTIVTKKTNSEIVLELHDNGLGIPDEIKDKIFQPFFTTKETSDRTGLGLSITNDIVKSHGGRLDVISNSKGSIFTVAFPIP